MSATTSFCLLKPLPPTTPAPNPTPNPCPPCPGPLLGPRKVSILGGGSAQMTTPRVEPETLRNKAFEARGLFHSARVMTLPTSRPRGSRKRIHLPRAKNDLVSDTSSCLPLSIPAPCPPPPWPLPCPSKHGKRKTCPLPPAPQPLPPLPLLLILIHALARNRQN